MKRFLCLTVLLLTVSLSVCAHAVSWTGTEWNGDISGTVGERNCDIVQIGREPARTDSIPYETESAAIRAAVIVSAIFH